jgi:hypothetical protein
MEKRVSKFLSLVNSGKAVVSNGTSLYNLTTGAFNIDPGQLGMFDYNTKIAISSSVPSTTKKVYFVVGVDADGDGTTDNLEVSLPIDIKRVTGVEKQDYVAPVPQMQFINWAKTSCETDYCLKVNVDSVEISEYLGFNPLYKTFTVTTDCCDADCDTCGGGDCALLGASLVEQINADPDKFFSAALVTPGDFTLENVDLTSDTEVDIVFNGVTTTSAAVTVSDDAAGALLLQNSISDALVASGLGGKATVVFNATTDFTVLILNSAAASITLDSTGAIASTDSDGCSGILLTTNFTALSDFCQIPTSVLDTSGVSLTITGLCGFDCNLTVTEPQKLVYEMNNGVTIKNREEESTGFGTNLLYRYTSLTNTPDSVINRDLYTDASLKYVTYAIEHVDNHEGAPSGHRFDSTQYTILAVATSGAGAGSTTETAIDTLVGLID